MISLRSLCWPTLRSATRRVFKHHGLHHRIGRAARRAAGIAASKPAIVAYVCVMAGAGVWSLPAQLPGMSHFPSSNDAEKWDSAPLSYWPPEAFGETPPEIDTAALIPPLFISTLPPEVETPTSSAPPNAVPEPSSIGLLATAVAALAIIRGRA